ncbi:MAG: DUF488 domain-containing protein [Niabella sp.]
MPTVKIKRIYNSPAKEDGFRVLVDRLWPRGVSKEEAELDLWLKEAAPTDGLRKWFNHEADKWVAFEKKYNEELMHNAAFGELQQIVKKHSVVTLLYGAKDEQHNQAVVLQKLLQ